MWSRKLHEFSRAMFRCDELSIDVAWDFVLVSRGMFRCDTPTIAKTKIPVSLQLFAIADCLSSLWDRRTADLPCFRAKIHDLESRGNPQSQKRCSPRRFSVFRFPRCFKSGAIGGVDLACLSQLGCGAVGRVDLKQRCWLGRADSVLWVASGMTLRGVPVFR